jgi:hypothetical protein
MKASEMLVIDALVLLGFALSPRFINPSPLDIGLNSRGTGTLRLQKVLALCLIFFGILLRVLPYMANRSFWGDEIAIALNVRFRTLAGLMHHLDYEQTMPLPLLAILKLAVSTFGTSEYVFRLPMFLAGCLSLPALWLVFRKLFGVPVALTSLAMLAISRPLVYYSSEVKQYGIDALVTIITIWFAVRALQGVDERAWEKLTMWGAVALCLSQPAIFVLAGVCLAAALDQHFRDSSRWRRQCLVATSVWAAVFVMLYLLSYRSVSQSPYMLSYWASRFLHPLSPDFVHEIGRARFVLLGGPQFDVHFILLEALFVLGMYGLWRRFERSILLATIIPFALTLVAAMLGRYPIEGRLVLFLLPLLWLIYAMALVVVSDQFGKKYMPVVLTLIGCALLARTAINSTIYGFHFPAREGTRQIVAEMNNADTSAPVYILFHAYSEWAYYAGNWNNVDTFKANIAGASHTTSAMDLPQSVSNRKEVVGGVSTSPGEDDRWIQSEAEAIDSLAPGPIWLFLAVYPNNDITGYTFKQRKLLERLQDRLARDGWHVHKRVSFANSAATLMSRD